MIAQVVSSKQKIRARQEANVKENPKKNDGRDVQNASHTVTLHSDHVSRAARFLGNNDNNDSHKIDNGVDVDVTDSPQGTKRRRRSDSDDENILRASTRIRTTSMISRPSNALRTQRFNQSDLPSPLSSTTQTISPSTIYTASPNQPVPQPPNPSTSPLEAARYRLYMQHQAHFNYTYLTSYITRARQDWQSTDRDPELLAPITAAEELWEEEHNVEVRYMQERTRLGDAARFLDSRLLEEPVVVVNEMKRRIRRRVERNKKRWESKMEE